MSDPKKTATQQYAELKATIADELLARLLLNDRIEDPMDCVLSIVSSHLESFNSIASPGSWKYRWDCGNCPRKGMVISHEELSENGATCPACAALYSYANIADDLQCGHWYEKED